jgi:PAS domain S-box-containing protein
MGIILNVTKNITRVFGYTKETIIGQNINEIMPKSMQK